MRALACRRLAAAWRADDVVEPKLALPSKIRTLRGTPEVGNVRLTGVGTWLSFARPSLSTRLPRVLRGGENTYFDLK